MGVYEMPYGKTAREQAKAIMTTQPIKRVFGKTREHLKESNNNICAAILSTRVAHNKYPNNSTMMEGYMNTFPNVHCPSCSPCVHDLLSNCSLLVKCRSRRRHIRSCRGP